jgi:hypothetical protein
LTPHICTERLIDSTIAQRLIQKYQLVELEKQLDAVLTTIAEKEKKIRSLPALWKKRQF